jgi:spermidine synthase
VAWVSVQSLWHRVAGGRNIGYLLAVNTAGAILGALFFGFFADQTLGLWKGVWIIALLYCLISLLYIVKQGSRRWLWVMIPIALVTFSVFSLKLPLMGKNVSVRGMKVIEVSESAGAAVAVVGDDRRMHLLINNQYSLGSNSQIAFKQSQALLPLLLHQDPKKVCFVGMGTGITSGAALRLPVDSVTVCEIVPGVITLAKKYFQEYAGGLFSDPRVSIRPEDGRNYLNWTRNKFDVIVSDLFIPWQSGTGTIYTTDYFSMVKNRLKKNGLFAQWLPFYQLSKDDAGTIIKTLCSVFPMVTVWRLDFDDREPVIGLIAGNAEIQLDSHDITNRLLVHKDAFSPLFSVFSAFPTEKQDDRLFYSLYCGNASAAGNLWHDMPLNSDDLLPIEFKTAKSHLSQERYTGERYLEFCRLLKETSPPEKDPYCARLDSCVIAFISAGFFLQKTAFLTGRAYVSWGPEVERILLCKVK